MVYLHPLAFLLGYECVALLRALKGEHDRAFVEARFTEITELLDAHAAAPGVEADIVSTVDGYGVWTQTYDLPGNGIFAFEEAVVRPVIESLPRGVALDLRPIVAEFARVLRPGGRAVIADTHHENKLAARRRPQGAAPDGRIGALPWYRHLASDYINAALPVGLRVRGCEEPRFSATATRPMETEPVTE